MDEGRTNNKKAKKQNGSKTEKDEERDKIMSKRRRSNKRASDYFAMSVFGKQANIEGTL
jgi:hypothetical protein